jgi:predicted oxidoreductase
MSSDADVVIVGARLAELVAAAEELELVVCGIGDERQC